MKKGNALLFASVLWLFIQCSNEPEVSKNEVLNSALEQAITAASGGKGIDFFKLPESNAFNEIPQDPNNPLTEEKVALGKFLFHETDLANAPKLMVSEGKYSCASCHHVKAGFQAGVKQGIGEGGTGFGLIGEARTNSPGYPMESLDVQPIRTPTALNVAFQKVMLWNGQFGAKGPNAGTEAHWTTGTPIETNKLGYEGVEIQAIAGLGVHRLQVDTAKLKKYNYLSLFDAAFPNFPKDERYTQETTGLAIAAYERTLLSNQSPFQQWLRGDRDALTEVEKEGALLFFGKAGCVQCHTGPALNAMEFYALGMPDLSGPGVHAVSPQEVSQAGKGRGSFTGSEEDMYKFKVPQLYNLKESPFYGHGGNFNTIQEIIAYKNEAVPENDAVPQTQLAAEFKPLQLTADEMQNLVTFIEKALYDPDLERYVPEVLPSGKCFPNADEESMKDLGCN